MSSFAFCCAKFLIGEDALVAQARQLGELVGRARGAGSPPDVVLEGAFAPAGMRGIASPHAVSARDEVHEHTDQRQHQDEDQPACPEPAALIGLLTLSSATLELDLGAAVPDKLVLLLVIVLAALVAAVITLAAREKWRRAIIDWIRRMLAEARQAARGLDSPRRLALLLGGNLATEFLFAFAAVLLYRKATLYLPPIWGYFALRWLERNKHL